METGFFTLTYISPPQFLGQIRVEIPCKPMGMGKQTENGIVTAYAYLLLVQQKVQRKKNKSLMHFSS